MKRKVSLRLRPQLFERLEAAVENRASTKTAVIEAALDHFLALEPQRNDDTKVLRQFELMGQKLERIERDLSLVNETVALHARYHLTMAPPMPHAQQRAACILGLERFEAFAAQVAMRVGLGTPLMRETIDRLGAPTPHKVTLRPAEGARVVSPATERDDKVAAIAARGMRPAFSAAAREGGSDGRFPGAARVSAQ
jgi:predicted transcriptional regulator